MPLKDYILELLSISLIFLLIGGIIIRIFLFVRKHFPGSSIGPEGLFLNPIESVTIYKWLKQNTDNIPGKRYKSTEEISKACNLTVQQVFRGCFYSAFIFKLDDDSEEMWTIYPDENVADSKYQES